MDHKKNKKFVELAALLYLHEVDLAETRKDRIQAKERYFKTTERFRQTAERVWENMMMNNYKPSLGKLGTHRPAKHGNSLAVHVVEMDHKVQRFPSLTEAAKSLAYSYGYLWKCIKNQVKNPPFVEIKYISED